MDQTTTLDDHLFGLDAKNKCDKIDASIAKQFKQSHCAGIVVPISGGLDSSVVASLCTRTIGKGKAIPLMLKERFGNPESESLWQNASQASPICHAKRHIDLIIIHG